MEEEEDIQGGRLDGSHGAEIQLLRTWGGFYSKCSSVGI